MFFSVITKNLDWKILTKNLVTFKRWDGVIKNLILWRITEKSDFQKWFTKTNIQGRLPKKAERLGKFADLRGGLAKKWRVVFLR